MSISLGSLLLNQYRVLELIGEGSTTRVWLAEDVIQERLVAIKEVRSELPLKFQEEVQSGFRREMEISKVLPETANVVRIHSLLPYNNTLLLVMDYMPGGNLAQRIAKNSSGLPLEEVIAITFSLLTTLAELHYHPLGMIVHENINPLNILFDKNNLAHLTGFWNVQVGIIPHKKRVSSAIPGGLRWYVAPEQNNNDYLTPAANIYSLGCILFEMLTGKRYNRLFPNTRVANLRQDVPESLIKIVDKALAENPTERYQSAAAMLSDLRRGEHTSPRTITVSSPIPSPIRTPSPPIPIPIPTPIPTPGPRSRTITVYITAMLVVLVLVMTQYLILSITPQSIIPLETMATPTPDLTGTVVGRSESQILRTSVPSTPTARILVTQNAEEQISITVEGIGFPSESSTTVESRRRSAILTAELDAKRRLLAWVHKAEIDGVEVKPVEYFHADSVRAYVTSNFSRILVKESQYDDITRTARVVIELEIPWYVGAGVAANPPPIATPTVVSEDIITPTVPIPLPVSTPTPTVAFEVVELEKPTKMRLNFSESIRISLKEVNSASYTPTPEVTEYAVEISRVGPVEGATPETLLVDSFGTDYQIYAIAEISAPAFTVTSSSNNRQRYVGDEVIWDWVVLPTHSGDQVIMASVDIEWIPIPESTGTTALADNSQNSTRKTIWRQRYEIEVEEPFFTINFERLLGLINTIFGQLGVAASLIVAVIWVYRRHLRRNRRNFLTTKQASKHLNLPLDTIRNYCKNGEFPGATQLRPRGEWRIPVEDIESFEVSRQKTHDDIVTSSLALRE